MIEFLALITAQKRTTNLSHEALPGAPIASSSRVAVLDGRLGDVRRRASLNLRRLADRLEPAS